MKKQLNRKYLWIILGGLLLIAGIVGLLWATNALGWRAFRLVDVENFIGAPLPQTAADSRFATQNKVARVVWLRFTLPDETALAAYLESLQLGTDLRSDYTPFPAPNPQEAAYDWWKPNEVTQFSGLYAVRNSKVIEILTNQTASDQLVVYVRAYSLRGN